MSRSWCKYCKTFYTSTKLGQTQHDTSDRHKRQLARFIQELHKQQQTDPENRERLPRYIPRPAAKKPEPAKGKEIGERWVGPKEEDYIRPISEQEVTENTAPDEEKDKPNEIFGKRTRAVDYDKDDTEGLRDFQIVEKAMPMYILDDQKDLAEPIFKKRKGAKNIRKKRD
ncbi:hypothetical protein NEOLI_002230 [Neolecta irregularis DAH-3]|uniref:U1-type domain-containing protein n=1 Tax=Neolecta irregularis (strain DAH-3) TaxID=1198029 RepID=A0A1U7LRE2_NEOID|nr:hypothetical protein NEOLI_002230 [Neolecta irregularis DAH-3]|eukprot:OLL25214.1 hypothetical protein NEOLI_002230 [Neolecta irregularis DAH-3]